MPTTIAMPRRRLALLLATLLMLAPQALPTQAGGLVREQAHRRQPSSFADAFQRGSTWSVGVYTFVLGEDSVSPRVGAGFLVDDRGAIATVAHLVDNAQQVLVALPSRQLLQAKVEGVDKTTDIALLRIDPPPRVHPVLARSDGLQEGDWVLAVGEPFGLEHSVSAGIVSGKDRHFSEDGEVLFLQSDVSLNPGNSGGPLLDATGAIVGMNARTIVGPVGTPGASLAIPIEIVLQIINELRSDNDAPARPRLGALFDDVPPASAWAAGRRDVNGALIVSVPLGSLAERMHLLSGDIVTMMNGQRITGSADFVHTLLAWRTMSGTRMVVHRAGQELVLSLE
jgi:serine protease Do